MQRALQLANLGKFEAAPNPRVGAVIVYNNLIIGEGYHQKYGEAHAEVHAINSVKDSSLLKDSSIYVTLEPCSHFGKTPPCADLLIKHQFKRVIICNTDPFKKVNGSGIKKLKDAGIDVEIGLLKKEGRLINQRFFTFHLEQRPFIILKWAQSTDGFIAPLGSKQKWITGSISKQLVHLWRAEESAILVGKNTANIDNPELTVREVSGNNPTRILIDENLEITEESNLFSSKAQSIVLNAQKEKKSNLVEFVKGDFRSNLPEKVAKICYDNHLQSIIIEGGSNILQQFISEGLWDEARVFTGQTLFKTGIKAPTLIGTIVKEQQIENDKLQVIKNL